MEEGKAAAIASIAEQLLWVKMRTRANRWQTIQTQLKDAIATSEGG